MLVTGFSHPQDGVTNLLLCPHFDDSGFSRQAGSSFATNKCACSLSMKRKQPSPLVRVRYYSTSTSGTGSSAQSSVSVRDCGSPREPTARASPTLAARKDAPAWHPTSRGAKECASSVTHSQTSRDLVLHDLHREMNAHRASGRPRVHFIYVGLVSVNYGLERRSLLSR